MELDGYLRAHSFMQIERPPLLWEADTEDEPFLRMLGEMIVVGLNRGNELGDLVLNVSNMVVEPDDEPSSIPPGDYVAITIRGPGDWEADDVWRAGEGPTRGLLESVGPAADEAGAVFVYTRKLGGEGSVTAFLPRLET